MNTRFVTFSLATAVGICFTASQLKANEPAQPDEVTQSIGEPPTGDEVAVEQDANLIEGVAVSEGWMICEGWMAYEEAIATDDVIEQTVANEVGPQDINEGLGEGSGEIVCVDEFVESDDIAVAEEMAADELLESDEVLSEETEIDYVDDDVQTFEELAARDSETSEEEFADVIGYVDLLNEFECVEGFDGWIVERSNGESDDVEVATEESTEASSEQLNAEETTVEEMVETIDAVEVAEVVADEELIENFAQTEDFGEWFDAWESTAEELLEEETTVEETVETAEAVEVEDNVEVVEPAIEEAISDDTADNLETEELADAEVTEEIATAERLAEEVELSSEEFYEGDVAIEEPIEELIEQAIEEETTVEETVEATDTDEDDTSLVAVETSEEHFLEQESVEDVQDVIAEPSGISEYNIEEQVSEDVTNDATDEVVENEETLEVVEPLIEEVELQETVIESTRADDVAESEVGIVRTFELGGCKITIQSERPMDDFELLDMLWEAIYQLEGEMD